MNYSTSHSVFQCDPVAAFQDALRNAGLGTPHIIPDGKLHRFRAEGDKPGFRNGWYVLYLDSIPAGAFGSWRTGLHETWCLKDRVSLSPYERARLREINAQREAERLRNERAAAMRAQNIWSKALPVDVHPYLRAKQVLAHGIRQHMGCLVIPLRDTDKRMHSLQFIDAEGNKRFLRGGVIQGYYHAIGKLGHTLCIAEGYATAATIYQCTGHAVACAFNAGNLKHVAIRLRAKYPNVKIVLCADNDRFTPSNPGVTKAIEASKAVSGFIVVPRFKDIGPYDYYKGGNRQ
jgi:Uncharacterized protein conserved in bacteria